MNLTTYLCGLVLVVLGQSTPAEVAHIHLSPDEKFLLCAQAILGKPISRGYASPWPGETVHCPQGKQRMLADLRIKGFSVFESEDWVYLVPTRWLSMQPGEGPVTWKRVAITLEIDPGDKSSARLSPALEAEIERAIRTSARTVPINAGRDPDKGTDTVTVKLTLLARAADLASNRESVLAMLGGAGPG